MLSIGEVAKSLNIPGFGRNKLFEFMKKNKILDKHNIPYQKYIDLEYFKLIKQKFYKGGIKNTYLKTVMTVRGMEWIETLVKETKYGKQKTFRF